MFLCNYQNVKNTYSWRFLLKVDDSYTRVLIEILLTLTRKAQQGLTFALLASFNWTLPLRILKEKCHLQPKI